MIEYGLLSWVGSVKSMMRELRLLGGLCVVCTFVALSFSQSGNDSSAPGQTPFSGVDCNDPFQASSPECMSQSQGSAASRTGSYATAPESVPQLKSLPDTNQSQFPPGATPPNPPQGAKHAVVPETEFEQMVADSAGRPLP